MLWSIRCFNEIFHPDIMFKVIETSSGYQIWMYHN